MARYIQQLRRGHKDDTRDDWAMYEDTKYIQTSVYNSSVTYYSDKSDTVADPQPTKSEVENGGYYIKNPQYIPPLEGELVLEYDHGVPRLKIGNGIDDFSNLPYMSIDSFVIPKRAYVYLDADNWVLASDRRYYQEVTVQNATITKRSKVDLQPNSEQLAAFHEKDLAFVTENEDGNVRVYCVGQVPKNDYEIQVIVTEVLIDG